jgi:hypothetical protein
MVHVHVQGAITTKVLVGDSTIQKLLPLLQDVNILCVQEEMATAVDLNVLVAVDVYHI